ncbi:MAG: aminoglycoside phosphotransferase [Oceanospirillaceae bacterium]|nr:aminoglycoside phosphotransferase [Oceanospirillaceae bacterium]MBT13886.1 aminoglycoside phosphotransferase [Oceanospirillaceae bacterium]|tara:strand:- start:6547 stop:7626 length:1080 start_codon:yes stop_codon:yes gene_type:complete
MTGPDKEPFELLTHEQQLQHLQSVAQRALPAWGIPEDAELRLLSLSENATYLVTSAASPVRDAAGEPQPVILRVHRTGYHSKNAIRTELAWMKALQAEEKLATPQAVSALNGEIIQTIETPALKESRFAVLFELIPGEAPDESRLIEPFKRLGAVTARMHRHARQWPRPDYFERLIWDFDGCLGAVQLWGDWRDGPGLCADGKVVLENAQVQIEQRLQAYGRNAGKFGLIHADLRLANLLESDGETRVIDFDDAGLGWFMYDLASAVSFIETRADLPELIQAWIEGYRTQGQLSAEDIAEIPTFIMLRRMTLLAWIGSHSKTELAREQGEEFTQGTLKLAARYLQGELLAPPGGEQETP